MNTQMKTKSICIACGRHESNKTYDFNFSMCNFCVGHLGVKEVREKELRVREKKLKEAVD